MKANQQSEIIQRLRCAAGHLDAVIDMAENGQSCEKVLHQLNAVEAALHVAGFRLLMCHLHQSEAIILASPSPLQRATELKRLQSLYAILIHKSDHHGSTVQNHTTR
jgi:DNA-binding FrmR family transcriptional regulator